MIHFFMESRLRTVFLTFFAAFWSLLLQAQSTNASIVGLVTDDKKEALVGASIVVRNESTGFQTGTATNEKGEYSLRQLPLGGPYAITVNYTGYQQQKFTGYSLNQGDRLMINAVLPEVGTLLAETVITAGDFINKETERAGAVTTVSGQQLASLPNEGRTFSSLISLSPVSRGNSLGGQRSSATNYTVDGSTARNLLTDGPVGRGPYTISLEAVREFEVSTNDYDVEKGREGGGSVNVVTKNGTNNFEGSAFTFVRHNELASKFNINATPRVTSFETYQYGATLSGPIIRDKLHFFVAFDRQQAATPELIANVITEAEELRIGIRRDTLEKLIRVAREKYGLSDKQQYGEFERKTVANALFTRFDWQLNKNNLLTFRNNFTTWNNPFSVNDNSNINLAESWSDFGSYENAALVSLRTSLRSNLINELKVQHQYAYRFYTPSSDIPAANIPRAIVTVTSPFPTEANPRATQTRTVQFGGQRFTPETDRADNIHVANSTYWSLGKFNLKFGTDNLITFLNTKLVNEMNGRFFFANMNDFVAIRPNRYAREVPLKGDPTVKQTVFDLSAFAQAEFNATRDLNLLFGLRYDATIFARQGDFNPTVFETLGIRTDNKMNDFNNIQPRLQLTWDIAGRQRDLLKIGGGIFSAQPVAYLQVNNIQNSGTIVGAVDVSGAQVPRPNFEDYRRDPNTAPGIPAGASFISTINTVSDDFQVPTVFKANASYNRFIGKRLRIGANFVWSRTINNYVYFDRNLVDNPAFTLSNENDRGVYVPANTIPANGTTDWTKSRKTDRVGRVLELESEGFLNQWAAIVEASYELNNDGFLSVAYTRNEVRDNSSFNCCVANTSTFRPVASNPRELETSFSDNHFSDKLVLSGATPRLLGLQLGAQYTGLGGTRYSFLTGGNRSLNGDFVLTNDLAFVFDPNNPNVPTDIRQGIQTILDNPNASKSVKEYINKNLGKVAERNGGINPFAGVLDLRLTWNTKVYGKNRLELSADCFNFINLLDKTMGVNNNHNNVNLVSISGFNQTTRNYTYRAESGAGVLPIGGTPWRIQVGARYIFK